ncbi:unnamed protein product, partial [Pylaiella littoralis]
IHPRSGGTATVLLGVGFEPWSSACGSGRGVGARRGGGSVDVVIGLLSFCLTLPSHAPLVAFNIGGGCWSMWSECQAVAALRQVVAWAGRPREDFALHYSLQVGSATYLAAAGATPEVLRKEGGAGPARRGIGLTCVPTEAMLRDFPTHVHPKGGLRCSEGKVLGGERSSQPSERRGAGTVVSDRRYRRSDGGVACVE